MSGKSELQQAIETVLEEAQEDEEFKVRFKKLIENSMEKTYRDDDIRDVIKLINVQIEVG